MLTKSVKKNSLIFSVSHINQLSSVCSCGVSFFFFEHRALFSFTLNYHSRHTQSLWGHYLNLQLKTLQEIYEHKQKVFQSLIFTIQTRFTDPR